MKKPRLTKERIKKIKTLRNQGYSVPEIAKELGIAKSTVFRYVEGVEILPEFVKLWFGKRGGSRKRKALKEAKAIEEAQAAFQELSNKEKALFLCALYWAEGSKRDFGLSNTDPELIRVFINGLRQVFEVPDDDFRISVRIYEDLDKEECLLFWSEVVGIPKEKFINVNILQGKKKGKLKYGMCRVRVAKGGDLLKKIAGTNTIVAKLFVPIAQLDRAPRS